MEHENFLHIHRHNMEILGRNMELKSRVATLEAALKRYADKTMWSKSVPDEYSRQVDVFDWVNEPHVYSSGFEIAEEALAGASTVGGEKKIIDCERCGMPTSAEADQVKIDELIEKVEEQARMITNLDESRKLRRLELKSKDDLLKEAVEFLDKHSHECGPEEEPHGMMLYANCSQMKEAKNLLAKIREAGNTNLDSTTKKEPKPNA